MTTTLTPIQASPSGVAAPQKKGRLYNRTYRQFEAFYPFTSPQTLEAMATDRAQIVGDYFKKAFPRHQLPMLVSLGVLLSAGILKSRVSASAAKKAVVTGLLGIFGSSAVRYFDVGTRTREAVELSEFAKKYAAIINDPRANSPSGKILRQLSAANPNADPEQLKIQARQESLRQSVVTSRLSKAFMFLTALVTGFPFPFPVIRPITRKIYDRRNSQPIPTTEPVRP